MSRILRALVAAGIVFTSVSGSASSGTESIPTVLQQVRIGDRPLVPNTAMSPPVALVHPAPQYTMEALSWGIEGVVTVRAQFDIDGNFEVLGVVEGLPFGLDEMALRALENWRFRPAYRSGRRVSVVANIDVEFRNPTKGAVWCVADYDGDGNRDVLTVDGLSVLYRNNGDGTFSDVDDGAATLGPVSNADCALAVRWPR